MSHVAADVKNRKKKVQLLAKHVKHVTRKVTLQIIEPGITTWETNMHQTKWGENCMFIGTAREEHENTWEWRSLRQREIEEEKNGVKDKKATPFELWFVAFSDSSIQPLGQRAKTCQQRPKAHVGVWNHTRKCSSDCGRGHIRLGEKMHDVRW